MPSCFECDSPAEHAHHVVPRSLGGVRTVLLCSTCHAVVHDAANLLKTGNLTSRALKRKRDRGEYTGGGVPYGWVVGPSGILHRHDHEQEIIKVARQLREKGLPLREIGAALDAAGYRPRSGQWHPAKVKIAIGANT